MKNLKLWLATLFILAASTAHAVEQRQGNERGNGGDALVSTSGDVRFLDLVRSPESVILDPEVEGLRADLEATLAKNPGFANATYFPADSDTLTESPSEKALSALDSLNFYLVKGPIPEVNDRGYVVLPWNINGTIVRLALQDRRTRTVIVDRDLFAQLPQLDRTALMMHEALIRVYYDDFYNEALVSTAKIAALVNQSFSAPIQSRGGLNAKSVARYLCDAGITTVDKQMHGLRSMPGILGVQAQYPNQAYVFSRSAGRCEVQDFRLDGASSGRSVNVSYDSGARALQQWTFNEVDAQGRSYRAWISYVEKRDHSSEFSVESHRPGAPSLIMLSYQELTKARVGIWVK